MSRWKTRAELEHQIVTRSAEGVTSRALARALRVSRNTVRKVLRAHGAAREVTHTALPTPPPRAPRPKKLDAFDARVGELLVRFPEITAQRVLEELRGEGYDGGYTAVKEELKRRRPRRAPEPSRVTPVYGPGEMAESDWSPHLLEFRNGTRAMVQVLSYVLCWSRRKHFLAFERCDLHALMDGHIETFTRFDGAAATCKYDSQKAVVQGWEGRQPVYNPRFLAFATHYEFRPEACRVRHPNDKPKTERSFWEFEQSFLNGRSFFDFADLRTQLAAWNEQICDLRVHRATRKTALAAFAEEHAHLRRLPLHPYDTARVEYRVCSIDGFVSFEGNRYSVPYEHVTELLPVRVTQHEVFLYGADLRLVARHERAPRGAAREVVLFDARRSTPRGADREQLERAFHELGDGGSEFFAGLAAAAPRHAGYHARQILLLRERYTSDDLLAALRHGHAFGAYESRAVERILSTKAPPRRLASYVAEQATQRYVPPSGSGETCLRELAEYDRLPVVASQKESPCPIESPPPPTSSSPDCGPTSSSSD